MTGRSPPGPTCSHHAGGQAHTFVDSGTLALTSMTAPGIVGADMAHVAHGLPPSDLDTWRQHPFDAARFIYKALQASRPMVGPIIVQETGVALGHLVEGLIPGLLMAVGVLGASTVLGTVVGGAVGAFAGGIGAAPGAALGGQLGFDIGMAALAWMGLAFIVASLGQGLPKLNQQAELGIKRAVHAMNLPPPARPAEMLEASRHFAQAQALLFKLILMGLVAWLLKKGAVSSAQQVGNSARAISGASKAGTSVEAAEAGVAELVAQLRKSRLGNGFADWVEGNWRQLIENPKLRPQTAVKAVTKREAEVVTPSQLAKMRQRESEAHSNNGSTTIARTEQKTSHTTQKPEQYRLKHKASSGVDLVSTPDKTTTILGNFRQDMKGIVGELGNKKSTDFGPRTGDFNVLNVPDELYKSPKQFWNEYNEPWLKNAIDRKDPILMATKPEFGSNSLLFRANDATGKMELSGFGKEYLFLRQNGYSFDAATNQMIR